MIKPCFSLLLLVLTVAYTAPGQSLRVATFEFGTGVEDRELIGKDTVFTSEVGTVFCYTRVKGAVGSQQIKHMWYYKDQPQASITLPIESDNWRTWSSKNIRQDWTGPWRVIIEDGQGNILANKSFFVVNDERNEQ